MIVTWEAVRKQSSRPYYYSIMLGGYCCSTILSNETQIPDTAITWLDVKWFVKDGEWVHQSDTVRAHQLINEAMLDLQTTWLGIVPPQPPKDDWEKLSQLMEDAKHDVLNSRMGRVAGTVVAWLARRLSKTAG